MYRHRNCASTTGSNSAIGEFTRVLGRPRKYPQTFSPPCGADFDNGTLHKVGGGRNFERPNVERLIFRNLKITGEGQNFEQVKF